MDRTITYYEESFANIPKELKSIFDNIKSSKTYKKGEMIYTQGEHAKYLYYLKNGQVKIFVSSQDGYEKTLSIIGGGGILGHSAFFDELPRISSAKAIYESEIIAIDKDLFIDKIKESSNLAMSVLRMQAKSVRMLSSQITSLTFYQADCRIARTLINAKLKENNNNEYSVFLTHEEIGDIVGVSRVTVSKILNEFSKCGYIETKYRKIIIKKVLELKEIANYE